jgi:hypothetical protein
VVNRFYNIGWLTFLLLLLPTGAYAELPGVSQPSKFEGDSKCDGHELKADEIKQKLRRWPGLRFFNRWRLKEVTLDKCVEAGAVHANLSLAPPESWSHHRVPYRLRIRLRLDLTSGSPLQVSGSEHQQLAGGVRRLVLRAEEHEDVRRFIERFPPENAEVVSANGPGRLRVTYRSAPVQEAGQPVELSFSEAAEEGVVAYRLPRMDSLPVRRELLHFAEVLSQRYPRCRPNWVVARWREGKPEVESSSRWKIQMDLEGAGCPKFLRAEVTPEWAVTNLDVGMPDPPKKQAP